MNVADNDVMPGSREVYSRTFQTASRKYLAAKYAVHPFC